MPEMCSNSGGSVGHQQLPSSGTLGSQRPGSGGSSSNPSRGALPRSSGNAQHQPDRSPPSPAQPPTNQQQQPNSGSDNEDMGYGDEVISYKDEGETSYAVEELPHAASADTLQDIKCSLVNEPASHYGANHNANIANNNNNHLNNNNPVSRLSFFF